VKSQSSDLENPESQNWKGKIGKIQFGPPFFCCEKIPSLIAESKNVASTCFKHYFFMMFSCFLDTGKKPCQKSSKNLQLVGGLNPSEKY
jgi:hypothetical protein